MEQTPSVFLQFLPLLLILTIVVVIVLASKRKKLDAIIGDSSSNCCLCSKAADAKKPKYIYGHLVCKKCYFGFANQRQLAFIIDSIAIRGLAYLLGILFLLATAASGPSKDVIESTDALLSLLALAALFCKDGFSGYSPGKRLCGVRVIDDATGHPAGFGASFKRNLPLIIPFMPLFVAFQLCNGHRVGDGWSASKVIWKKYANNPVFAPSGNNKKAD